MVGSNTVTSTNIADGSIVTENFDEDAGGPAPLSANTISLSVLYASGNSTSNGESVMLTGSGFVTGTTIMIANSVASVVTVHNSTTMSFTAPSMPPGTYVGYIIKPNSSMLLIPGLNYA